MINLLRIQAGQDEDYLSVQSGLSYFGIQAEQDGDILCTQITPDKDYVGIRIGWNNTEEVWQ